MKLVTIQTKAAYESLVKNGYLVADEKHINLLKYGVPYSFIIKNMLGMENTEFRGSFVVGILNS